MVSIIEIDYQLHIKFLQHLNSLAEQRTYEFNYQHIGHQDNHKDLLHIYSFNYFPISLVHSLEHRHYLYLWPIDPQDINFDRFRS